MVKRQLRPPIKKVRLAGSQFGRPLIFANRRQRVTKLLLDVSQEMMHFGVIVTSKKGLRLIAGLRKVSGICEGGSQFERIPVISRLAPGRILQVRNRFLALALVHEKTAQSAVGFEIMRIALQVCAQRFLLI